MKSWPPTLYIVIRYIYPLLVCLLTGILLPYANKHVTINWHFEIIKLRSKINSLKGTISKTSQDILNLEMKIRGTKEKVSLQKEELKWNICSYKASSATVLKRCSTSKHNNVSLIPEIERSSNMWFYLFSFRLSGWAGWWRVCYLWGLSV